MCAYSNALCLFYLPGALSLSLTLFHYKTPNFHNCIVAWCFSDYIHHPLILQWFHFYVGVFSLIFLLFTLLFILKIRFAAGTFIDTFFFLLFICFLSFFRFVCVPVLVCVCVCVCERAWESERQRDRERMSEFLFISSAEQKEKREKNKKRKIAFTAICAFQSASSSKGHIAMVICMVKLLYMRKQIAYKRWVMQRCRQLHL